jgi:hypothetical protein
MARVITLGAAQTGPSTKTTGNVKARAMIEEAWWRDRRPELYLPLSAA